MNFKQIQFKQLIQIFARTNWLTVIYQLMTAETQPFTALEAVAAISQCFRFLQLVIQHPHCSLVPTQEIDAVLHILEKTALFNRYFDHQPGLGTRGEADRQDWLRAFQATRNLFEQQFGRRSIGTEPACCQIVERPAFSLTRQSQPAACEVCLAAQAPF